MPMRPAAAVSNASAAQTAQIAAQAQAALAAEVQAAPTKAARTAKPAAEKSSVAKASSPVSGGELTKRIEELKDSGFSNLVRGTEAVIQGIRAASSQGNKIASELSASLLEGKLSDEPSIQGLVREASYDENAARFSANTSQAQLRRLYMEDLSEGVDKEVADLRPAQPFGSPVAPPTSQGMVDKAAAARKAGAGQRASNDGQ